MGYYSDVGELCVCAAVQLAVQLVRAVHDGTKEPVKAELLTSHCRSSDARGKSTPTRAKQTLEDTDSMQTKCKQTVQWLRQRDTISLTAALRDSKFVYDCSDGRGLPWYRPALR